MSTGGVRAGGAFIELFVKDGLGKGLRAAQAKLQSFAGTLRSGGLALMGIGAAVLGPVMGMASMFSTIGDEVQKMAIRTGMAAESVSALRYAAGQSGTSIKALENGIRRSQRTIADAVEGDQTAVDALGKSGLDPAAMMDMTSEDQLKAFAESMSQIENPTERAAAMMEVFGRSGAELIPMFEGGAAGIESLMQKAGDLGLIMDRDAADSAAALNDAWDDVKQSAIGLGVRIGAAVAPVLTQVFQIISQGIGVISEFAKNNKALILTVTGVFAGIMALGIALLGLSGMAMLASMAIGGVLSLMGAMSAAVAFLATPLGAVIAIVGALVAPIVALGAAFAYFSGAGSWAVQQLAQAFEWLRSAVFPVLEAIFAALAGGRFDIAGKIMWSGLKVAFFSGMQAILAALENWEGKVAGIFGRMALQARSSFLQVFSSLPGLSKKARLEMAFELAKTAGKLSQSMKMNWGEEVDKQLKEAKAELEHWSLQGHFAKAFEGTATSQDSTPGAPKDDSGFQMPDIADIGNQVQQAWSLAVGSTNSFAAGRIGVQARPMQKVETELQGISDKLSTLIEQGEEELSFGE